MFRCVSVLLLVGLAIAAQAARWERLGPYGGRVAALAVAPSDPQIVYAGGAAVYRSTDGGRHWLPTGEVFPSFGPDSAEPRITALAVCPTDARRVLAASPQGLFLSTDGVTWRRAGTISVPIRAVAFSHGGSCAVAAGPSGLFRSPDGGATWTESPAPPMAAICEDPEAPDAFYGALSEPDAFGRCLVHSADGTLWAPLAPPDLHPTALCPTPDGASLIAAVPGPDGGVFRVPREGDGATRLFDTGSVGLAVPANLLGWVFSATDPACTGAPVFRTTNNGASWTPLRTAFGGCALRSFALGPDLTPLAGTDGGGVLACDATDTWHACSDGLSMACVAGVWRREDGQMLLAAADGLYRSADDGQRWNRIRAAGRRSVLAVSEARAGMLYLTGSSGLERSEDGGQTWRNLMKSGLPPEADVARIVLHPTRSDTVYVVLADGAVYRSTTSIVSFKRILAPFPTPLAAAPALALAPAHPEALYTLRPDGLYASADGGTTWDLRAPGVPPDALLVASPDDSPSLFRAVTLGDGVSVAVSRDGGGTWTPLWHQSGTLGAGYAATFLVVDPRHPDRLLLGTNRGLRISDNGGVTFRTEPTGSAGTFCAAWYPDGVAGDLLATDGGGLLRGTQGISPPAQVSDLPTALVILHLALTEPNPSADQITFADRDLDGRVSIEDAVLTLRIALGGG